jgi:hypothetical protein
MIPVDMADNNCINSVKLFFVKLRLRKIPPRPPVA